MKNKTLREIHNAFQSLLNEKPVDKITITEICQLAEINRGTFYRYYVDIYALLDAIIDEHFKDIRAFHTTITTQDDALKHITALLENIKNQQEFFGILFKHSTETFVRRYFNYLDTSSSYQSFFTARSFSPYLQAFIIGGCSAILVAWGKNNFATPTDELALQMYQYATVMINFNKNLNEPK